jgi:signal transduction histidine kinase
MSQSPNAVLGRTVGNRGLISRATERIQGWFRPSGREQLSGERLLQIEELRSERRRIARELHDSLLQGFQGLMFRLQAVRDLLPRYPTEAMQALEVALDGADKAIAEGRDTVADLRHSPVGNADMAQALTALGEGLALQKDNGTGPCIRVLMEGKPRDLDPLLRDEVYRIAREALRNAFRHSQAHMIEAEIGYGDSQFLLRVRDDGNGIGPEVLDQGGRAGHWGIPGMLERAKSLGGRLEVWSEHAAGTEVQLVIPASIAYGQSSARRRFWFRRTEKWGDSEHDS